MAAKSATGRILNASISKIVQNVLIYMCANVGAFRTMDSGFALAPRHLRGIKTRNVAEVPSVALRSVDPLGTTIIEK